LEFIWDLGFVIWCFSKWDFPALRAGDCVLFAERPHDFIGTASLSPWLDGGVGKPSLNRAPGLPPYAFLLRNDRFSSEQCEKFEDAYLSNMLRQTLSAAEPKS